MALDARTRSAAEFKNEPSQGLHRQEQSASTEIASRNPVMHRFTNTITLAIRNLTLQKLRVLLTALGLDLRRILGDRHAGHRRGGQP